MSEHPLPELIYIIILSIILFNYTSSPTTSYPTTTKLMEACALAPSYFISLSGPGSPSRSMEWSQGEQQVGFQVVRTTVRDEREPRPSDRT